MRIAQITSIYLRVPPRSHGGTELQVARICDGLAARGHEVALFASGDSSIRGKVESVVPRATLGLPGHTVYLEKEYEARNAWNLARRAEEFDVLHGHWPCLLPYFCDRTARPSVLTYAYIEAHLHHFYREHFPRLHPVCVSHAQAREISGAADGGGVTVIPYGIDVGAIPFGRGPREGLLTVGRITPGKGIGAAIRIARAAGERLTIVGDTSPYLPWSEEYFREEVAPFVDGDRVAHHRNLPNERVLELMASARAFLLPLDWEEPFGLVLVEALAAGCPVVARPRGAAPEIVRDGVTGFLRETEAELAGALRDVDGIDRSECRRSAVERFSEDAMVTAYETLYGELLR